MATNKELVKVQKEITDEVMLKIQSFQQNGEIKLPEDYSAENALKSAMLILVDTVDKAKKPVLDVCTRPSIANSLLNMVIQGLSPVKKQCYFIAYGDKLSCDPSYQGQKMLAKRVGLKDVIANVIYEKDVFSYAIDPKTGRKSIVKHEQEIGNIDFNKIKGAYAVVLMEDGTQDMTLMTKIQINKSWAMGGSKGGSKAHTNFTDEMCNKTVVSRACKHIINSSDDAHLNFAKPSQVKEQLPKEANKKEIGFDDAEIVDDEKPVKKNTKKKEEINPEPKPAEKPDVDRDEKEGPNF